MYKTLLLSLLSLALPAALFSQAQATLDGPFQVNYASNLNLGDGVVNITNSGAGAPNLCVNIYGYVPDEQQAVCCSCNVSQNSLHSFPLVFGPRALFGNPLTAAERNPTSVVIKLLATNADSRTTCPDPRFTPVVAGNLRPGLVAWGTHSHPTNTSTVAITETPFVNATLSANELAFINQGCAAIGFAGSGAGVCPGCGLGGLAAPSL